MKSKRSRGPHCASRLITGHGVLTIPRKCSISYGRKVCYEESDLSSLTLWNATQYLALREFIREIDLHYHWTIRPSRDLRGLGFE